MTDTNLVFEDEDSLVALWHFVLSGSLMREGWWGRHFWQEDSDGGASSQFALDANVAPALVDNPIAGGQTKPTTAAVSLSGKEGFEQMLFHLIIHANAIIFHADADVIAWLEHLGMNLALVRRVDGDGNGLK